MAEAHRGVILHAIAPDRIELFAQGVLLVDAAGRVERIIEARAFTPSMQRGRRLRDWGESFILPGLVDAHLHIPQIDVIGIESEHLIDWLRDHIFTEEAANADPLVARDRARRTFEHLLASGTTCCAAYSSSHTSATTIAFEEAERAGLRAVIGKVLMDRGAPTDLLEEAGPALEATVQLIRRWSGAADGRLEVAITPRFGLACSDALLRGAGELARRTGRPVQTHLSENKAELAATAELFPWATDYTAVYEQTGLLGHGGACLLAHCIHMSDGEFARLAAARAAAVYCPDSNFFLHSGRFPLERAAAQGVTIALGSDVGAGTSFSLFEAMKMGNYMQTTQVDPHLLFYLATLGGAAALGWQDRIGNFEPGKEADLVVLDPSAVLRGCDASLRTPRELLSILIHRGHLARVERVFVRGRAVWPSVRSD